MLVQKRDDVVLCHSNTPESLKFSILENTRCSPAIHVLGFLCLDIRVPQ